MIVYNKATYDFYVAECSDYNKLGNIKIGLTLKEAYKEYEVALHKNMYLDPGIGIIVHDKVNSFIDNKKIIIFDGNSIDFNQNGYYKEYLGNLPGLNAEIEKMKNHFQIGETSNRNKRELVKEVNTNNAGLLKHMTRKRA